MKLDDIIRKHKEQLPNTDLDIRSKAKIRYEILKKSEELKHKKTRFSYIKMLKFTNPNLLKNLQYLSLVASFMLTISGLYLIFKNPVEQPVKIAQVSKHDTTHQQIIIAENTYETTTENLKSIELSINSRGISSFTNSELTDLCFNSFKFIAKKYKLKVRKISKKEFILDDILINDSIISYNMKLDFKKMKANIFVAKKLKNPLDTTLYKSIPYNNLTEEIELEIQTKIRLLQ